MPPLRPDELDHHGARLGLQLRYRVLGPTTRSNPANPLGMTGGWTQFQLDAASPRHSVASSARRACHSVASSGTKFSGNWAFSNLCATRWHRVHDARATRWRRVVRSRECWHDRATSTQRDPNTAGPELPLLQIGLRTLGLAAHRRTRPCPNPATSAHMRRAHAPATLVSRLPQTHVRGAQQAPLRHVSRS